MEKKTLLSVINKRPHSAKNALKQVYKGKVYAIGTNWGSVDTFIKTFRGAEGYIKKQGRYSWCDDHTNEMVCAADGLMIEEIQESEILNPSTSKQIWYEWLKEIHGKDHMYSHTLLDLQYYNVTDEIKAYVTDAVEQMKRNEGLHVIAEYEEVEEEVTEIAEDPASDDNEASLIINNAKNGIEIKFKNKPSLDVIEALKEMGFKWSKFAGLWWARNAPERLKAAQMLIDSYNSIIKEEPEPKAIEEVAIAEAVEEKPIVNNVVSFMEKKAVKMFEVMTPEQRLKLYTVTTILGKEECSKLLQEINIDQLFTRVAETAVLLESMKEE